MKVSQVDENASCLHVCGFGHLAHPLYEQAGRTSGLRIRGTIVGVSLLTEQSAFITKKVSQVDENASCLHVCGFGHL